VRTYIKGEELITQCTAKARSALCWTKILTPILFWSPNVRPAKSTHSEVQVQVHCYRLSREIKKRIKSCAMISDFKPWVGAKVENFELQTRSGFPGHYSIHLSLLVFIPDLSFENFQGLRAAGNYVKLLQNGWWHRNFISWWNLSAMEETS
jgi:hypothetical protein